MNKNTDVLLINPNKTQGKAKWLPLGIAYIAAVLEKEGFQVKVIDVDACQYNEQILIEKIINISPLIIGLTSMTPSINKAFSLAKICKNNLPNTTIVLGGVHATILPNECIKNPYIDIIVKGEGEITFLELAYAIKEMKSLRNIEGITYKDTTGKIISNPRRKMIDNLDSLPFPARHLFPFLEKYSPGFYRKLPYASILTSRGCPGKCTYCNKTMFGNIFRYRSAKNVVDEIEFLNTKYSIKEFHIMDDNFSTDVKRANEICDEILRRKLDIVWACPNGIRVDFIDQELLNNMKKSGCYRIAFGLESGNQNILNNINKNITLEQGLKAVLMAKKANLIVQGFFMIGNYGETRKTVEDTIMYAKKLKLDYAQFTIAVPFPGTKLYKQVISEGELFAKNYADYEIYSGDIFEWKNLSIIEMKELEKKAWRDFYFNKNYLIRKIYRFFTLQDIHDISFLINGLKIFKNVYSLKPPTR